MIAYLDLPSGISGDMFLGCLIDAGWSVEALIETLSKLAVPGEEYEITCEPALKGPLRATQVTVDVRVSRQRRTLSDIRKILADSNLSPAVKGRAEAIFVKLAEAEAKVHGTDVEEIHFHEVGAVDAIVDVVGAAAGIEALGIETLYASALPLGDGWVRADHGMLPLPAPATLELLAGAKAPTKPAPGPGELVTPTGAAIVATLATFAQPRMTLHKIGIGAGRKDFAWPNVARLWLGEPIGVGSMVQIETNIDDMNPQLYASVTERLFAQGAADVWVTPIQMKKGRPANTLSVLAPAEKENALADAILRETTTLGVRVHYVHRHEAGRSFKIVATEFGDVRMKLKHLGDEIAGATPEYDDCKRLADQHGVPVRVVIEAATNALK